MPSATGKSIGGRRTPARASVQRLSPAESSQRVTPNRVADGSSLDSVADAIKRAVARVIRRTGRHVGTGGSAVRPVHGAGSDFDTVVREFEREIEKAMKGAHVGERAVRYGMAIGDLRSATETLSEAASSLLLRAGLGALARVEERLPTSEPSDERDRAIRYYAAAAVPDLAGVASPVERLVASLDERAGNAFRPPKDRWMPEEESALAYWTRHYGDLPARQRPFSDEVRNHPETAALHRALKTVASRGKAKNEWPRSLVDLFRLRAASRGGAPRKPIPTPEEAQAMIASARAEARKRNARKAPATPKIR